MKNWSKEKLASALKKDDAFKKLLSKRINESIIQKINDVPKKFKLSFIKNLNNWIKIGFKVYKDGKECSTFKPYSRNQSVRLKVNLYSNYYEDNDNYYLTRPICNNEIWLHIFDPEKSLKTSWIRQKLVINKDFKNEFKILPKDRSIVFHKDIHEVWEMLFLDRRTLFDEKKMEKKLISELESLYKSKSEKQALESKKIKSKMDDFNALYDSDKNNKLDILENDGFSALLKQNQSKIIEIDKLYIQKFVKLSMYLTTKSNNLQKTYDLLIQSKKIRDFSKLQKIFDLQYDSYSLLLFRSYEMVLSLIKEDLITFYEIYEIFDSVGIFESNWESEMKNTLNEIKVLNLETVKSLLTISKQIQSLETSIINQLSSINQSISDVKDSVDGVKLSVDNMNKSLTKELKGVNNKLWWNNLFQVVQIYQNRRRYKLLRKINSNL